MFTALIALSLFTPIPYAGAVGMAGFFIAGGITLANTTRLGRLPWPKTISGLTLIMGVVILHAGIYFFL